MVEKVMEIAFTAIMREVTKDGKKATAKVSGTRIEYTAEQLTGIISEMFIDIARKAGSNSGVEFGHDITVKPEQIKKFQEFMDAGLQSAGNSRIDITKIVNLPSDSADEVND